MLFFTIAWTVLIFACFPIGAAILNLVSNGCFERIGDRFIIAVWLGVLILAGSLLCGSLFVPLSPLVGVAITISLTAISLCFHRTRTEIIVLGSVLSLKQILGFLGLEIAIAIYAARAITWYDTGLYHFQVIRWLSRFGTVPGLALIHSRFGFTSSWFALAAPFNAGIFEARIGAIAGGFIFLLAILQVIICVNRILKNQQRFEDWFIIVFLLICLPLFAFGRLINSSSTDVPVIIITGLVGWMFIIVNSTSNKISFRRPNLLGVRIIPLLISAGATTIKLSAFPLLFVSAFFYIFERKFSFRRIFFCCALGILLLLPMLGFGIITSGCPLFPSSLLCLNLPWTYEAASIKVVSKGIQDWNRWGGSAPAYANSWNWLGRWVFDEKLAALLIICSLLSIFILIKSANKTHLYARNYLIAVALLGMAYMMYGAPSLRFGLGYLCLMPIFLIAYYLQLGYPPIVTVLLDLFYKLYRNRTIFNVFIGAIAALVVVLSLKTLLFSSNNQTNLLLPPKMQTPDRVLTKKINDIDYTTPLIAGQDDRCWAAEIPCTPENLKNIKLRNPKLGIAAGFLKEN